MGVWETIYSRLRILAIYCYTIIPFKPKEKVIENIAKVVEGLGNYYSRGGAFNRQDNNCEHFAKSVY